MPPLRQRQAQRGMSVIEAALTRTWQASAGLLGLYVFKENCIFNVDGGERGVLFQRFRTWAGPQGILPKTKPPGTHFILPWFQQPTVLDVKAQPKFIKTQTATKDLQQVNIGVRILHRPILKGDPEANADEAHPEEKLTELYRKFGASYDERILPSIMNEVMKTTVAQYNAEELLTKRESVRAPGSLPPAAPATQRPAPCAGLAGHQERPHKARRGVWPEAVGRLDHGADLWQRVRQGHRAEAGGGAGRRALQVRCAAVGAGEADEDHQG